MRVLYLLRYYPTLSETFVYREIAGLQARGVEVVVAALGQRADGALADELPEVQVVRPPRGLSRARALPALLQALGGEGSRARAWLSQHQRPKEVLGALWLARWARAQRFDRIHVHFAGEAAEVAHAMGLVTGLPWSVTVHAADLFKPRPSLPWLLGAADPVLTIARHHQALLGQRYGVEATLVRCGVDPARYPPAAPGEEVPMRVVSVGRDVPKKGLDLLVDAAEEVGVDLRLVSDAPRFAHRARVGSLPPSQIPGELSQAQLFALPCRRAADGDLDGIPVALMEAMAAGLPVLTTPVSGIPELVDESVGWLVPPDDPAELARALREIGASPAERARRGEAGRQRIAEAWTAEQQVQGLLSAWGAP